MGHRNARRRGRRNRTRHAGYDVVSDPGALQRQRFFAPSAEDERIAPLEPDDAAPFARRADHQPVNRLLRHRVFCRALADIKTLRPARVAKDPLVDEGVVQHQVGGAQLRDRLSRQQPGVARSRTDERHPSGCRVRPATCGGVRLQPDP
jgi:hypothetical protein